MKREFVTDLWALGIILLALSVLIPFPWVEFKTREVESGVIAYNEINPASEISSKNGPTWTATLVLVCSSLVVGLLFLPKLYRWSVDKEAGTWYLGEISIALAISSLVALNLNPTPIFGLKEEFTDNFYFVTNWYPHVGFYLVVAAIVILLAGQALFRRSRSTAVRKVINIQAP